MVLQTDVYVNIQSLFRKFGEFGSLGSRQLVMIEIHLEGQERVRNDKIPVNLDKLIGKKLYTTNPNNADRATGKKPTMIFILLGILVVLSLMSRIYEADFSGLILILAFLISIGILDMVFGTQNVAILSMYPYIIEFLDYDKELNEADVRLYCRGMITQFKAKVTIEKLVKYDLCDLSVFYFSNFKDIKASRMVNDLMYEWGYSSIYLDDKYGQIFNLVVDSKG